MTDPRSKRSTPAFFLGIGVVCLVTAGVGGHIVTGAVLLAVMAASALALLLLARRSETYRCLAEGADERFAVIGEHAWAGTGVALTIANLGALAGSLAAGDSGNPYYWFIALAAVAYIALAAFFSRIS